MPVPPERDHASGPLNETVFVSGAWIGSPLWVKTGLADTDAGAASAIAVSNILTRMVNFLCSFLLLAHAEEQTRASM